MIRHNIDISRLIDICPLTDCYFKASVRYFLSNFYFWPNDSPSKTMKNVFFFLFHLKISFRSRDIQVFVFPSSPLFPPASHCFRGWSKINLKVYDAINCLNKNLITHFIWCREKEKSYEIETFSIDRVLNKEHFFWSDAENVHQKLVPDSFLMLVNNPKQPLHARNSVRNKIFWKRIIKKP